MFVRGTWWGIDNQVVEFLPNNICKELLDESILTGTTPDNGVLLRWEQKSDRHDSEIVFEVYGRPSLIALVNFMSFESKHTWHRWATNIDVKQSNV